MFRRSGPATLGAYVRDGYALIRDVRPSTLGQYRIAADLFERWARGPIRLDELDERSVSGFLRDYSAQAAPDTVRSKRNSILALWRAAADDGLCDEPVGRRVRRCCVPETVTVAWTKVEVEQLLEAAARLPASTVAACGGANGGRSRSGWRGILACGGPIKSRSLSRPSAPTGS